MLNIYSYKWRDGDKMSSFTGVSKIQLVLFTGIFFDLNCMYAMATDYAPISSNQPISLNNGDRVIYNTPGNTTGITGVDSSSVTSSLNVNGQADINIKNGGKSTGIHLSNNSNQNNFGQNSSITVSGVLPIDSIEVETVNGIEVLGTATKLSADSLTINATNTHSSGGAIGVRAQNGGTVVLTGENTINVTGGTGAGTGASAGLKAANPRNSASTLVNEINVDKVTINVNNGIGAYADAHGRINLGNGSVVTTTGNNSNGIVSMNTNAHVIASGVTVKTSGTLATAILARGGGDIDIGAGSSVETESSFGLYVNANAYSSSGSAVSSLDYIGADGNRNKVIVNSTNSAIAGAYSQGTGAALNIEKTDIVTTGASGVKADAGGTLTVKDSTIQISPVGTNKSIFAAYTSNSGSSIDFIGNTTIIAHDNPGSALFAASRAQITVNGKVNITGNIDAFQTGSLVSIDATSGSVFNGHSLSESNGTVNIKMTDSIWNMNNNSAIIDTTTQKRASTVTNLTLNDSVVNFLTLPVVGGNQQFAQLTTDTLSGNATFNMNTDIVGQQGDLLVVNNTVAGNHKLGISNNGSAATDGTETLTIVKTGAGNTPLGNFSLANKVELGAYEYGLREVAGSPNDLELYASGAAGASGGGAGGGTLTTTAEAAGSFLNIGYLTNYIENQTLLQRLGDLRNNEYGIAKQDGFWMKGFGGKLNSFAGNSLKGFDMTYTGTQFGIDRSFDVNTGRLLVGAMAGFTDTNPNYRKGNGNGKNYTAGLYTTYLLDDGFYIDNVLKFNRMRNQFNVKDTAGGSVKGRAKTYGVSFSTEVGKRFWLEGKNQGFYLEPQAQLSYGYQTGDTVKASNGLRVGLSHYNSTLGRVSGIAGYQIQGNTPINVYLKTGFVREMSGGASYRFNDGDKKDHSFRSNWFDTGIGIDVNINKKHNIYAEADYATGNQFDNAKFNLGYRYSF